jgi:hypothetical protein
MQKQKSCLIIITVIFPDPKDGTLGPTHAK